jgi:hypothetical protein
MGINEIDYTIHPYTVGREDCKVLPRSFKTLAEAEAYLAEQDTGALERGEFYLDGPEQDEAAFARASKRALVISADVEGSCGESTHTQVGRRNKGIETAI